MGAVPADYSQGVDPERALKYAVQNVRGDRAQIIEGIIEQMSPAWDHEAAAETIRDQIKPRARELDCMTGSGNLDLPGSPNWYVPDLAVVPVAAAKGGGALLPDQTLLVVEVTSESNAETDRVVKRRRYAEYGAPLYLLVDRTERSVTLFAEPGRLGYTRVDGPHPFGTRLHLPAPFDLDLRTDDL
ncbi:Uma2 family endonuclease [Streptomyces tirandamycinicus]|uniref:Uma2 family endonuclease n=1 Tax=Streptomyces tirandamycinicus TaxID=2174846 RepID=UPI0003663541|nr:Uma2 family endonuclease [Streptomyces tirandamycinicus]MCY0979921.1 Uma2 family endonuclease [Streptomyces tirandamycinicus]